MMFKKKKKNASMMITDDEVSVEGEENLDNPLSKIKDKLSLMKKKDSDKENSSEDNKEEEKEEIRKDLEEDNNRSIDDNNNTEKKDNKDFLDIMYGDEEEKEEDNILLNESKKEKIKEEDNHKDDLIDINYGDDDKENNNEEDNIIEDKEKEDFNDKKNKIKEDHPKRDLIDIKYDKDDGKKKHHKEENKNKTDFNTDFIKNNHPTKPIYKKITGLITDIILIILIGYFVVWISPKIVNWFSGGREKYVDLAKSMTVQVKNSFDVSKKGCSTSINHRYFFNIYNSKEQFGDEYVSPIDGQPMEGYIEFELYNSDYTTYITLSDGFFGINHVKLEELSKSDIKVFTFLGLDTYEDMKCNKPIEITRK